MHKRNIRHVLASWFSFALPPILLLALILKGANSSALASGLSTIFALLAIASTFLSPAVRLEVALKSHVIPLIGLLAFVGLCVATTTYNPILPPHPIWHDVGIPQGVASLSPTRTLEGLATLIAPICAYMVTSLSITTPAARSRFFLTLTWGSVLFALFALNIYGSTGQQRLSLNFVSGNSSATVFYILALFGLASIVRNAKRATPGKQLSQVRRLLSPLLNSPISVSSFILCLTCLLLTASRAGQASALVGLVVFTACLIKRFGKPGKVSFIAIGIPLLLITALALLGGGYAFRRFENSAHDLGDRSQLFAAHFEAFTARPWFGHGLNTFHELNDLYMTPENWRALRGMGATHNIYIQSLEETGIIGASLLLIIMMPIIFRACANALSDKPGATWAAASLAATVATCTHGLVDFGAQTPAIATLLAACLGATNACNDPPRPLAAPSMQEPRSCKK